MSEKRGRLGDNIHNRFFPHRLAVTNTHQETEAEMSEYEQARVSTGVSGLDDMLGGGLPEEDILLVSGGPGTGKTIMSLQYINQAVNRGEPCVYISFEESMKKKIEYAKGFGWDLQGAIDDDMLDVLDIYMIPQSQGFVDLYERVRGKLQFTLEKEIENLVKRIDAKHVLVDPLTSILVHEHRSDKKRYIIGQLFDQIRQLGCSAVIVNEGLPKDNDFYMEHFLADAVILLQKEVIDFKLIKTLIIDKVRGINFDEQPRRYIITNRGMQVFNAEPVTL
jgi:KaiC/GvpD/RAD55 family RecA-like ATPase